MMRFFVPGLPIAQPRQRHSGRVLQGGGVAVRNYVPSGHAVHAFKQSVVAAWENDGRTMLEGPIAAALLFQFPRPAGKTWKTKEMPREWKRGKPDLDNLEKSVFDALNGYAYRDDAEIVSVAKSKVICSGHADPGVFVILVEAGRCRNSAMMSTEFLAEITTTCFTGLAREW